MADGSITFSTNLDNSQLEKQLQSLKKKITSIEDKISQKQAERSPLAEQSKQLAATLDAAKARLEYMKSGQEFFTSGQITTQALAVKETEKSWGAVQSKVERYDTAINSATLELERNKEKAGGIAQELAKAGYNTEAMDKATKKANKSMGRFALRVREVVRSALVFTLITQALAKFREWAGKVIKTNAEASASVARLKGALLTLAQPLVSVIIPAFTMFVDILTRIISTIAQLFAMITGKSIENSKAAAKALNGQTEALDATGAAAKEARKEMAGFDEINKLSGGASGASAGDSTKDDSSANFGFLSNLTESQLERILGLAELIGAALMYWKLPKALQGGLKTFLGLLLAIDGAVRFVRNIFDAWNEGVNWDNLKGMLIGAAELTVGLGLAFGPVAAGISLIVTGILMLVTGFRDASKNGWKLENLLLSIAGILATGLGIALITGSWIPMLIAGIASILLAITVAYGEGENLLSGFKTILRGFIDFFSGIFAGDFERTVKGIGEIFSGLKMAFSAVLDAVKNMFNSFLDWLDEKTHGRITGIIEWLRSFINSHIATVKSTLLNLISDLEQIFTGFIEFLSGVFTGDWEMAWTGIKDIFKGILNGIISLFEGMVNMVIGGLNSLIGALNALIAKAAEALSAVGITVNAPQIPSIPTVAIPRLATGAVIPPNREFLAVLGDQKSGNNYEVPDAKLRQLIREETRGIANTGDITIIMEMDKQQFGKVVYRANKRESRRVGVSLVEV